MRVRKTWWNHENFTLKINIVDEEGPIIMKVKPGGSIQIDGRYTRLKVCPETGDTVEHVDMISPHLNPNKPVKGEKRKVKEVTGVDPKGYAITKTKTVTTPEAIEENPTEEAPPKRINPNARAVDVDKHTGG